MAFISLPGLKMIARRKQVEAGLRRRFGQLDQVRHGELFVRQHETDMPLAGQGRPTPQ